MAFTIAHKIEATGTSATILTAIRDYFLAHVDRFEIIAESGVGASNGWLTVRLVGGTGWEVWIGAYTTGASTWLGANILSGAPTGYTLHYALAPAGGWQTGGDPVPPADGPGGTMFLDSALAGTWWGKIRPWSGITYSTPADLHWLTIMDDPTSGTLIILLDEHRSNAWADGLLVAGMDSRFSADDPTPVIGLGGPPEIDGGTDWLFDGAGDSTRSSLLLPGSAIQGLARIDGKLDLDADNQPSPISGDYDLPQIGIKSDTPGVRHNRGLIKAAAVRQVSSALGARTILGGGALGSTWIVTTANGEIVVPWDGTIIP